MNFKTELTLDNVKVHALISCVCAHGILVVALVHFTELVIGAFPDLEELSHLGVALLIGCHVHCDGIIHQPLIEAIVVWVQD